MGSVKDLEVTVKPTQEKMGCGRFRFSDRFSVFDWGEMPDLIDGKGSALCLMGAYCFEKVEERGVKTHYRGLVDEQGRILKVNELNRPTDTMEIDLVNVHRPGAYIKDGKLQYDYSAYTNDLRNYLIPLEIIYRNGLPEGSSVFKRLERGQLTLQDLGMTRYPKTGERLSRPIFDVSTKLEETDRYVSWKEAREISGLSTDEVDEVRDILFKVNKVITQVAMKADLENEDGKIELAFDHQRRLMVVDVIGTLDECRFTYEGLHISKEIARQYYRKTSWYQDIEIAKKRAEAEGVKDWKSLSRSQPPHLDPKLRVTIGQMYMAVANEFTEHRFFEVPRLAEVIDKYKSENG